HRAAAAASAHADPEAARDRLQVHRDLRIEGAPDRGRSAGRPGPERARRRHALRKVHSPQGGLRVHRRRLRGFPGVRDAAPRDHAVSLAKLDNRKGTRLMLTKFWKVAFAAALAALAAGCGGTRSYEQAKDEEQLGHYDRAVMNYAKALELDPTSPRYKAALARARVKAAQFHFEKGKMYRSSGRYELAVVEIEQSAFLAPTNDYAATELMHAREDLSKQEAERNAESRMETLKKKVRGARPVTVILEPSSDRPINLNFPQQKPIKQIYRALADAAGINVVFDPQLKDDNVSRSEE